MKGTNPIWSQVCSPLHFSPILEGYLRSHLLDTSLETPNLLSHFPLYYLNSIWHLLLSFINHYHWQQCPSFLVSAITKLYAVKFPTLPL